jgi:hypothetical protein
MSFLLRVSRLKALVATALSATFLQALSMGAHADVQVSCGAEALRIEASDASLEDVLAELGRSCGLQYRSPADFGHPVSGTFAGSLRDVLSRLLQGYNFVVESSASSTRIVIYDLKSGPAGGISIAQPAPQVAPARPAPTWRPDPGRSGFPPLRGLDRARLSRARRPPIGR